MPTTRVPAVICPKSAEVRLNVPAEPLTEIDLAPLGSKVTVPAPAFTLPLNETS